MPKLLQVHQLTCHPSFKPNYTQIKPEMQEPILSFAPLLSQSVIWHLLLFSLQCGCVSDT